MDRIRHLASRLRGFDHPLLSLLGIAVCALLFATATSPSAAAVPGRVRELGRTVDRVSVTPGEWSLVHFQAVGTATGLPRGVLVRPNTWLARERCEVGAAFRLEEDALELDLDVEVTGIEEVASLDVIPVVHTRRGPRQVIGWIERQASEIVTLSFRTESASDVAASALTIESVETTREHPFHSADRAGWVPARDLRNGERVTLVHGGTAIVDHVARGGDGARVCNVQVAGEAEYAVGGAGLVAHNPCIPGNPFRGPNAPEQAYKQLRDNHGIDVGTARDRLHKIKHMNKLGATDRVVIGRTGDVYDEATGEFLGSLTDKALGR